MTLWSCNAHTEKNENPQINNYKTAHDIQLPLKIRCDVFPGVHDTGNFTTPPPIDLIEDTSTFYGKIMEADLTILIKNKMNAQSPILYTLDKEQKIVDTLILFDQLCYSGTDSHYLPWIEITKDLIVIRTDTSYEGAIKNIDNPATKKIYELSMKTDTTITIEKFVIDKRGKIININKTAINKA